MHSLWPGVLLGDSNKPITGVTFKNVSVNGLQVLNKNFLCKNVRLLEQTNMHPMIKCTNSSMMNS